MPIKTMICLWITLIVGAILMLALAAVFELVCRLIAKRRRK